MSEPRIGRLRTIIGKSHRLELSAEVRTPEGVVHLAIGTISIDQTHPKYNRAALLLCFNQAVKVTKKSVGPTLIEPGSSEVRAVDDGRTLPANGREFESHPGTTKITPGEPIG